MAGEEPSKSEFTSILTSIKRKFDIIHTKWLDDRNFEAKFRTQISRHSEDYNGLCDEWVDLFSEATSTTWVKKISNTGPKVKFRKQYQCWTHPGKVQKELLFDARRCRGTIDVKVLTDNPQTRRKNKHIKMGLNVVIKINFTHLHSVCTTSPYSFFVHTCEPQPEAPKPNIQPNDRLPRLISEMVERGRNMSQKATQNQQEHQNLQDHHQNHPQNQHQNQQDQHRNQQDQHQIQHDQHHNQQQQCQPRQTQQHQQPIQQTTHILQAQSSQQHQQHTHHLQHQDIEIYNHQSQQKQLDSPILHKTLLTENLPQTHKNIINLNGTITELKLECQDQLLTSHVQLQNVDQLSMIQLNPVVPLQGMDTIKLQVQPQLQQLTQVVVSAPQLDMNEQLLMCPPTIMFDPSQVIPVSAHHFVQLHPQSVQNNQQNY